MEAHHSAAGHDNHDHGHGHGHGHGGHHGHKVRHFSDEERILWGMPRSIWNKCTDEFLSYKTCFVDREHYAFPFQFIFVTHYADRYFCKDEFHAYQECYLDLIRDFHEEFKDQIEARRK